MVASSMHLVLERDPLTFEAHNSQNQRSIPRTRSESAKKRETTNQDYLLLVNDLVWRHTNLGLQQLS